MSEVAEPLNSISDHQNFCDLLPVRAKGGEVYIYRNEQHPGEDCIYTAIHEL